MNLPSYLPEYGFEDHKTVNHSLNFVDPDDPETHTQNIEAFWSTFKRKLRSQGFKNHAAQGVDDHFGEYMYKRVNGFGCFEKYINEIKFFYDRLKLNLE